MTQHPAFQNYKQGQSSGHVCIYNLRRLGIESCQMGLVSDISVFLNHFKWLSVQEDFTKVSLCESFKTYKYALFSSVS
jgi:hypothetical protein